MDMTNKKKKFYRYIHSINSLLSRSNKLDEQTYVELSNLLEDLEEVFDGLNDKDKMLFEENFKILNDTLDDIKDIVYDDAYYYGDFDEEAINEVNKMVDRFQNSLDNLLSIENNEKNIVEETQPQNKSFPHIEETKMPQNTRHKKEKDIKEYIIILLLIVVIIMFAFLILK